MSNELFVLVLALSLALLLRWGFIALPKERWQILGSVPSAKAKNGDWIGVNFTYYGFFNATSVALATAILLILLGSLSIPPTGAFVIVFVLLALCAPAARIVARLVEKKSYTFTIGGASFVGFILGPWLVYLTNSLLGTALGFNLEVLAVLASISIAYTFGECVGRLACISFGCCYGKPLSQTHPFFQQLFKERHFVFTGKTKKIAYAHGLDGKRVIPIQAITSVIYCISGIVGLHLFLRGAYSTAFLETLIVTQLWRFASEFLRADHRGGGKISAYQIMGLVLIPYATLSVLLFPVSSTQPPNIFAGLKFMWDPAMIVVLQCIWVAVFLFTGRSQVTGCTLTFNVRQDRI
jgi:hypothetical protein